VNIEVKESNHAVLMTPYMVTRFKDALERSLCEELKGVVEWVEGCC